MSEEDNKDITLTSLFWDTVKSIGLGDEEPEKPASLRDSFNDPLAGQEFVLDMGKYAYSFKTRDSRDAALDLLKQGADEVSVVLLYASTISSFPHVFLDRLAMQESSKRADVTNKKSGAAGLTQISPDLHLQRLYQYGEKHGYGELAKSIEQIETKRSDGKFDHSWKIKAGYDKQEIMDLRFEPRYSVLIALENLHDGVPRLQNHLNKDNLNFAEAYSVHLLGLEGAKRFFTHLQEHPNALVLKKDGNPNNDAVSWDAFKSNPGVFTKENGKTRTNQEVYDFLVEKMGKDLLPDMRDIRMAAAENAYIPPRDDMNTEKFDLPKND